MVFEKKVNIKNKKISLSYFIFILVLLTSLFFLSGCDDIVGKAVEGIKSEPPTIDESTRPNMDDDLTRRFEKAVLGKNSPVTTTTIESNNPPETTDIAKPKQDYTAKVTKGAYIISMSASKYMPDSLTISKGDTVRWINDDNNNAYLVFSSEKPEFRSPRISPGESFEHTFTSSDEFRFKDAMRLDDMVGMIKVE